MKLDVLAVGKLKDAAVVALRDEYIKRSRKFLPITTTPYRDHAALWRAASSGPIVLMDERGEQPTSTQLSGWLRRFQEDGCARVSFLIGDAYGFSDADRERADKVLALSALTLPHRLAQLVLCEQLYRAGTILAGHPYHH